MGTTDRKNIGKKAAVLAVLIGVFSGFTSQAAGDVFSTADSQPDTQTVQFRDSAPYVCTEERILPVPSAKITGLTERDGKTWAQIDTLPKQENVYLPELDESTGWIYVRSGSAKYAGGEYALLYVDGDTAIGSAHYVPLSAGRRYSCEDQEGNIWPAYCLQSVHGAADGKQMTMYRDTDDFSTQISQHGLDMASTIVRNGYPLNEAYWSQSQFGGICAEAQEYATQIALWCALRGEPGNDSGFYDLIYSAGTAAIDGTRMHVLEMVKTLVSCAESGQDLYQVQPMQIVRQESEMTETDFTEQILLSGSSEGLWKLEGIIQATVFQNGTSIDWQPGQWYSAEANTQLRIEIPIAQAEGTQAILTAVTADVRSDASVWWGSGASLIAADGRTVQDMAGIHKIISKNAAWAVEEPLYFPTEKKVILKKTDSDGNGLPGASFTLYRRKPKSVADAEVIFSGTTGVDGTLELPYLGEGAYVLEEDSAPFGYIRQEKPMPFLVSPDGIQQWRDGQTTPVSTVDGCVQFTWENLRQTGTLQLRKLESNVSSAQEEFPLAGVGFSLYYGADVTGSDGSVIYAKGDPVLDQSGQPMQAETDADGRILFSDLPIGYYEAGVFRDWITYELRETAPLPGYLPVESSFFSFADSEALDWTVMLTMENRPNELIIRKVDQEDPSIRISGAVLQLWRADADGLLLEDAPYAEIVTTGEDWKLMHVPAGYYILREVQAPFGYVPAENMLIQVVADKETQTVEMTDARRKVQITIRKEDSVTHNPLADAAFEIRNSRGEVVETIWTDENGCATSSLLPYARMEDGVFTQEEQYFVAEICAPEGYQLRKELFAVYFPELQEGEVQPKIRMAELIVTDEKIPEEKVPVQEPPEEPKEETSPKKEPTSEPKAVIQASVPEVLGITEQPFFWGILLFVTGSGCLIAGRTGKKKK